MTTATNDDQKEVVDRLVFMAERCLGPWPPDLDDSLPERLDTFAFGLFPELEGAGGLPQMRLSPKADLDVNLVDHYMHDTWPNFDEADNKIVRRFLWKVLSALRDAQEMDVEPREAMGRLASAVCRVIEDGYDLRAEYYDENDDTVELGPNVAPGLVQAFQAAWDSRPVNRARKIAAEALHLAQKGDLEEAARYVQRLSGSDDLIYAMIGWIDTFMAHVYPEHEYGRTIALKFLAVETGDVGTVEDVDPSKAWAGRLISYRAADDKVGFNALLRALPEGKALGNGVMALLSMVAMSINNADDIRRAADKSS